MAPEFLLAILHSLLLHCKYFGQFLQNKNIVEIFLKLGRSELFPLQNIPSMAFCKALYKNPLVRDISHKITGATEILLFYSRLPDKVLRLQPNKNNNLCSCLALETMGKEVIESAKAVVVKKAQSSQAMSEATDVGERMKKLEENQEAIQGQIEEISSKIDLILQSLSKK